MTERYSISSTKTFVLFANWFGIISSALGVIVILYASLSPEPFSIVQQSQGTLTAEDQLIYSILLFSAAYSLASCAFIINFTRKSDDITFINNRYVLVLFSLSIGGLWTPFILSRLPNTDIRTTLTPRITISQGFAVIFIAAGIPTFAFIAAYTDWSNLFSSANTFDSVNQGVMFFALGFAVWGLINAAVFFGKNASQRYQESGLRGLMLVISSINLVIATAILFWMIVLAILNIISLFGQLFDRRNGFFGALLNSVVVSFKIAIQIFVLYTAWKCIFGIWAKENFEYSHNANFAEKEQQYLSL